MEWLTGVQRFLSFFLPFFLLSCASTDFDEHAFESSEEESQRVLNDSYVVEEQKKLKDYKPDAVALKTIPMDGKRSSLSTKGIGLNKATTKGKKTGVTSSSSKLSQSELWKDQDLKSEALWKMFSSSYLKVSERHVLDASYTGINAASLVMEVRPEVRYQSRDVFHFQARAKTADFYKWIYSLNDVVDSLVDKENFVSWKYSLIQKEKNKDIEDVQFYDRNSLLAFSYYKKTKANNTDEEKKQKEIPFYGLDYFSSLFFVRGLPLKDKDHYVFPTTTKSDTWLMSVRVLGREKIKIALGEFQAIKIELMTKYTGDLAKKGPINIWLTDDNTRTFLYAKAEVKIGSIKLELSEYQRDGKILYGKK